MHCDIKEARLKHCLIFKSGAIPINWKPYYGYILHSFTSKHSNLYRITGFDYVCRLIKVKMSNIEIRSNI